MLRIIARSHAVSSARSVWRTSGTAKGGGGSHDIGAEESLVVYIRRHHLWEEVESHDTVREQGITGLH
jgi:hypothetical protein